MRKVIKIFLALVILNNPKLTKAQNSININLTKQNSQQYAQILDPIKKNDDTLFYNINVQRFNRLYANYISGLDMENRFKFLDSIHKFRKENLCETGFTDSITFSIFKSNELWTLKYKDKQYFFEKKAKGLSKIITIDFKYCYKNKIFSDTFLYEIKMPEAFSKNNEILFNALQYYKKSIIVGKKNFNFVLDNLQYNQDSINTFLYIKSAVGNFSIKISDTFQLVNNFYRVSDFNFQTRIIKLSKLSIRRSGYLKYQKIIDTSFIDKNKKTILYFTGSWCIPCQKLTPILKDIYANEYLSKSYRIVAINYEKDRKVYNEYILKSNIPWKTILDLNNDHSYSTLKSKFNIQGFPTILVIDSSGIIADRVEDLFSCMDLLRKIGNNH